MFFVHLLGQKSRLRFLPAFFIFVLGSPFEIKASQLTKISKPSTCETFLDPKITFSKEGQVSVQLFNPRRFAARPMNQFVESTLGPSLGIRDLKIVAKKWFELPTSLEPYDRLMQAMEINAKYNSEKLHSQVPPTGPLIITANHPLAGVDGMVLAAEIRKIRPDVKVIMTEFLENFSPLQDQAFFVHHKNNRLDRGAFRWLKEGHVLIIFPAGDNSQKTGLFKNESRDKPWQLGAAHLAIQYQAPVLPIFVNGVPGKLYHGVSSLKDSWGPYLLFREQARQRKTIVSFEVGSIIQASEWKKFRYANGKNDYETATKLLRARTLSLKKTSEPQNINAEVPIIAPVDPHIVSVEMTRLCSSPETHLLSSGDFDVLLAPYSAIPETIHEIGRLREQTFREVGEGSGLAEDLDRFDPHYLHLILWDKQNQKIAGAYRLGVIADILKSSGLGGIYTSTLFKFETLLKEKLAHSGIEAGRSFVTKEYQRRPKPLFLLLKGIATFVTRRPELKDLFGPASISNSYLDTSKRLLMTYIEQNLFLNEFSPQVHAVNPPNEWGTLEPEEYKTLSQNFDSLRDLSKFISALEPNAKGVPILFIKYVELGARFLGFHYDKDFHTYDGLVWSDLSKLPLNTLSDWMGEEEAKKFLAYHAIKSHP